MKFRGGGLREVVGLDKVIESWRIYKEIKGHTAVCTCSCHVTQTRGHSQSLCPTLLFLVPVSVTMLYLSISSRKKKKILPFLPSISQQSRSTCLSGGSYLLQLRFLLFPLGSLSHALINTLLLRFTGGNCN